VNINWNPYKYRDIWEYVENAEEYRGSFDDYLTAIVDFLENEQKKYKQNIDDVSEKIVGDSEEMPDELRYAYYELESFFPEFENTLFSSFFVAIYFYLESELTRYCRDLEKRNPEMLLLSDIVGTGVQRSMTYLVKVQRIEFSVENSPEWNKILKYGVLRNCIAHNQGRVDEVFNDSRRKELLEFIQRKDSKLMLDGTRCILNKEFCSDALQTIKKFLYSVADAEKPKAQ
jgi:hypothetical protein